MIDITKARQNFENRLAAQEQANMERYETARQDCQFIIAFISEKYKPDRILLWGSLLTPEKFDENSDIDIAVEGIRDAETFFALLGDAMNLTRCRLDIVEIDKIAPEFAESIRLRGKVVYESPGKN